MVSLFLFALSGFFNSIMDTIKHRWWTSIFANMKKNSFWYQWFHVDSWEGKYEENENGKPIKDENGGFIRKVWFTLPDWGILWKLRNKEIHTIVQFTDAWHFFKMLMLIASGAAIVTYKPVLTFIHNPYILAISELLIIGIIRNRVFSIFYGKIWQAKEKN